MKLINKESLSLKLNYLKKPVGILCLRFSWCLLLLEGGSTSSEKTDRY